MCPKAHKELWIVRSLKNIKKVPISGTFYKKPFIKRRETTNLNIFYLPILIT